jgi:hypothetical protein
MEIFFLLNLNLVCFLQETGNFRSQRNIAYSPTGSRRGILYTWQRFVVSSLQIKMFGTALTGRVFS